MESKSFGVMNWNTAAGVILRDAPVGFMVCSSNGDITLVNPQARELAQADPEGKTVYIAPSIWGEMFDQNGTHVPTARWPCVRALQGEVTTRMECHMVHHDGSTYDILFSASPISFAGESVGSINTLADITQCKRLLLISCEESLSKERTHLAADLHDGLAQDLAAIMLQLQAGEREIPGNLGKAQGHFQLALKVARESLVAARRYLWTLSHEPLINEDLPRALSFLAEQFFAGTPVQVELSFPEEPAELSPAIRADLLQVGREALANVLKHAKANRVTVELTCCNEEVRLSVIDNGSGFAPTPAPGAAHCGFGLFSMRTRAERLGGKIKVDSQPGHGTRVVATVPLVKQSIGTPSNHGQVQDSDDNEHVRVHPSPGNAKRQVPTTTCRRQAKTFRHEPRKKPTLGE
jgi:signal transduction histidine kinase